MRTRGVLAGLCLASSCLQAAAETVVTPANGILWQAVRDVTSPIEWRWEGDDVTHASVSISSPMEGKTYDAVIVNRSGSSLYGSVAMPGVREQGREYLYDVVVELRTETEVRDTLKARLVYLPESIDVVAADRLGKRVVKGAALFSYDARWNDAAVVPAKVTVRGENADYEENLPGSSGYGYFSERALGELGGFRPYATLDFGDGSAVWSNYLRLQRGLCITVR